MRTPTQDLLTVRVGFDGTPMSSRAAKWAHHLAQLTEADVELVEVPSSMSAADVLADECHHADLMVLGTHGHVGRLAGLLGSTSRAIANDADCPVALVNDTCATDVRRCVVLWDGPADEGDLAVLRWTVDFARRTGLPVHVITPWERRLTLRATGLERPTLEQAERHHDRAVRYLRERAPDVVWTGCTTEGSAATVVAEHTYKHDLVAIVRDTASHVQAVVNRARGLVVVVPTGLRLRADERPSRDDLPVL